MNPALAAVLPSLIKVGSKVIDKAIPDPEQSAKAKAEFAQQAAQLDQEANADFQEFIVAYEGRGDAVHPFIQGLRGSVRPVITYALAAAFIWGFSQPEAIGDGALDLLFKLNLLSLGFWYGERALKNLGLNISKLPGAKDA